MVYRKKKTKEMILKIGTIVHDMSGEKYVTFKKLNSDEPKDEFIIYTMKLRKLTIDYEPE